MNSNAKNPGIVEYRSLMKAVAFRMLAAEVHLVRAREDWQDPNLIDLEFAALQLRQICEAIMLASFVLHSDFVEDMARRLRKNDGWDRLKKMLSDANPRFMPEPIRISRDADGSIKLDIAEDEVVSADELFRMWGKFSESLHYRNPLKGPIDRQKYTLELSEALERLVKLLRNHAVHLADLSVIYTVGITISDNVPKIVWTRLNRI